MSHRQVIRDFCTSHLSKKILSCLDISTLILAKTSFIGARLSQRYSDILYQVQVANRDGYVDILC